jgi:hypothetical protein
MPTERQFDCALRDVVVLVQSNDRNDRYNFVRVDQRPLCARSGPSLRQCGTSEQSGTIIRSNASRIIGKAKAIWSDHRLASL